MLVIAFGGAGIAFVTFRFPFPRANVVFALCVRVGDVLVGTGNDLDGPNGNVVASLAGILISGVAWVRV